VPDASSQPPLNPHYFFSYFSLKNALIFLIFASYAVMIDLTQNTNRLLWRKKLCMFSLFFSLLYCCIFSLKTV
ncbi:hypothetical protein CLOSYM_04922, partial [[Clostridium] symbiosum ATCC 14940]